MLMQYMATQGNHNNVPENLAALRHDPQGDANRSYAPGTSNAANPFSNGFFTSGASQMAPEAVLASQGNNATNQWAQTGANKNIDPSSLQQFNQVAHNQFNPVGVQSTGRQVADPFDTNGGLLPGVDPNNLAAPQSVAPQFNATTTAMPGGGVTGLANPWMAGPGRFGDANMFSAKGQVTPARKPTSRPGNFGVTAAPSPFAF